jgi:hypothetical protein
VYVRACVRACVCVRVCVCVCPPFSLRPLLPCTTMSGTSLHRTMLNRYQVAYIHFPGGRSVGWIYSLRSNAFGLADPVFPSEANRVREAVALAGRARASSETL